MKYFFDTEFIDNGKVLDLISIGIIAEDGRTYYAENATYNELNACSWVKENVISQLTGPAKMIPVIRKDIIDFVNASDENPEFWAYYAAYDWVCFCRLFGRLMDLPASWPNICLDIKQWAIGVGDPKLPEQTTRRHYALNDALWTRDVYQFLREYCDE